MDADYEARMKRIEEKHEALTQSVELLAAETREQSRKLDTLIGAVSDLTGAIKILADIVHAHEDRLERLEG